VRQVKRALANDQGVVYAEFIISFVPFFLLFLAVIQFAILATAGIVVQHAAGKAARAAMVVIDDNPVYYGEDAEPRGELAFNGDTDDDGWVNDVGGILTTDADASWLQSGTFEEDENGNTVCVANCTRTNQLLANTGGPRLRAIRRAAYLPLSLLSPEWATLSRWFPFLSVDEGASDEYTLRDTGIGTSPQMRLVTGFLGYNPIAAAINFPDGPQSQTLLNQGENFKGTIEFASRDTVTIRVAYLAPCGVPLVNALICKSLMGMMGLDQVDDLISGINPANLNPDQIRDLKSNAQNRLDAAQEEMDEAQRKLNELKGAEYAAYQYALLLQPSAYFHVVIREATLPIQKATYEYPEPKENSDASASAGND